MAQAMAPFAKAPASHFDILDEEGLEAHPLDSRLRYEEVPRSNEGVLAELSVDHFKNQSLSFQHCQPRFRSPAPAPVTTATATASPTSAARGSHRRPIIGSDTFKPLAPVDETGILLDQGETARESQHHSLALLNNDENIHPLASAVASRDITTPIQKQLAATPLEDLTSHHQHIPQRGQADQGEKMALPQNLSFLSTPLKMAGMVEVVEQMLSPPLTVKSDRTASITDAYSPRGSAMSSPRIEDSLAEIDRLEDELEAINLYTQTRTGASARQPAGQEQGGKMTTPSAKRVTIAAQPATMRIKSSEKVRPSLRRSSSLTLRDRRGDLLEDIPEQKVPGSLSRSKSTTLRSSTLSKAAVKSTKAPTVPSFELPGEAVSRRLKEQREARQAQQAEAEKAQAAPPKPRSQKPLTKPNFELPGEAISRRKREQHEAKLRAQEEEERKRREFKARPIRYSIGPSTLPRETITSRARQNKEPVNDPKSTRSEASAVHPPVRTSQTLPRGRNSMVLPSDTGSRATSTSTGSLSGQRSTLSSEDAALQRMRGREIYARDNSFTEARQKAKREKETAAQLARAEAAERSRALSREWAEKKRRKELSLRRAMRESMQPETSI
ncbi:hypothetical protein NLU13_6185 [Sarocladium strictum]|uniref:Carboxylesterase family protein n=1 Tax=Sarocladium strictum TaxID=5046 RepID=A0AA39GFF1_SARSR|nr:hypothetical protein NLU13_6185 [Sarocladium strictum]